MEVQTSSAILCFLSFSLATKNTSNQTSSAPPSGPAAYAGLPLIPNNRFRNTSANAIFIWNKQI